MEAVYGLLGVDRGVPEVWGSVYDIRDLLDASVKLMDGKSPLDIELPGPLTALKKPLLHFLHGTVVENCWRITGSCAENRRGKAASPGRLRSTPYSVICPSIPSKFTLRTVPSFSSMVTVPYAPVFFISS